MNDQGQRYLQAKAIIAGLEGLDDAARMRAVAIACDGDAALLAEVQWMLDVLAQTVGPASLSQRPISASIAAGDVLHTATGGTYTIARKLGEGGMGDVYLAERRLGDDRQQVALKLLSAVGRNDPVLRRRLASERRILAGLTHPNIARLLDGGEMVDGQPFLSMEYIDGLQIDVWCRSRALDLRTRIELFLKVCAGLQYAHRSLVIHRDIKPANVLVGHDGEPRLVDFGIASLVLADGDASARTQTMMRAMTLAYASPEQWRGERLTTASDVWSLGILLYELVCGTRPARAADAAAPGSFEIQAPGQRLAMQPLAERHGLPRRLPLDIDAIVLKALRQDPAQRYASVADLAADLQRHLAHRPVRARSDQRWYRVGRVISRHRAAVAAVAVVTLLSIAFLVDRESQLRRAQVERDKAQALAGFMTDLFEHADPSRTQGRRITVADMLDAGAAQLQTRDDLGVEARADMLLSIGRGYNALDLGARAIPLLQSARALQTRYEATPLEAGRVLAALARAHSMIIDLPTAARLGQEAIVQLEAAGPAYADEALRVRINMIYSASGSQEMSPADAAAALAPIIDDLRTRTVSDPAMPGPIDGRTELLVQALAARAFSLAQLEAQEAAMESADEALTRASALYGADDPALVYYRMVAVLVTIRSDPERAIRTYWQVVGEYDRVLGEASQGLAGTLAYFGSVMARIGRYAEAIDALQRAVAASAALAEEAAEFHHGTRLALAEAWLAVGQTDAALELLLPSQALLATRSAGADASPWSRTLDARARLLLAAARLDTGQVDAAMAGYRDAAERLQGTPREADALVGLGLAQVAAGDATGADATLQRRAAARGGAPGALDVDGDWLRARLLSARGSKAEARALAEKALASAGASGCDRRLRDLARLSGLVVPPCNVALSVYARVE